MSSEYDLLCVSHSPALLVETGESQPAPAIEQVRAGVAGHPGCDLLVGRWSGALVEICCVGGDIAKPRHPGWHRDPQWVDTGLLEIAAVARKYAIDTDIRKALTRLPPCWTRDRLASLLPRFEERW